MSVVMMPTTVKTLMTSMTITLSLLDSLAHEDRRIIVSGLLPRKGANIEPYNEQLKSLCEENDIEFYNNFDKNKRDKFHLNYNGTKKLLSNTDKINEKEAISNAY